VAKINEFFNSQIIGEKNEKNLKKVGL